jgi:hypothetical protein
MPDINNEYLIDKIEEQEEMFRNKLDEARKERDKHIAISKQLYECLLARIYSPPIVKGFDSVPTPQEREALDAFTNRDNG